MRGRHRRDNKWRYAAPVLGYTVAAALAVVAATSAHYGQVRSEEAASSELDDTARAHAAPRDRAYLPRIVPSQGDPAEAAPPTPPAGPAPAPTRLAHVVPEPAQQETTSQPEPEPTTSERRTAPSTTEPAPSTSEATAPAEEPTPGTTSNGDAGPTEPRTTQPEPTGSETTEPEESDAETPEEEPSRGLVGGVVEGVTDPVLGLLR
ncbi:hypothetical protein GCM10009854_33420 [Saccharopolyspora halophila]|uniref:Uncharacterized protein n=1 Tax=Saccharopolyspora halophila TaxID=405551 RepID=A0ABN3GJ21_9PSEU